MKALVLSILVCLAPLSAVALDEADFRKCVQYKDLTLEILKQADRGVSRSDMKAKTNSPALHEIIDLVYDFRGTMSNEQMAARQMENCLRELKARERRK